MGNGSFKTGGVGGKSGWSGRLTGGRIGGRVGGHSFVPFPLSGGSCGGLGGCGGRIAPGQEAILGNCVNNKQRIVKLKTIKDMYLLVIIISFLYILT